MNPIRTRTLEVTVTSGENLCIDQNPVMENMYVVVRTESIKCWRTKMANQGVGSLSTLWNEKLMVEMPFRAQSITFEVQCKTSKGVAQCIGLARIAISDVMPKEEGRSEVLSYRLRNWEGRRSGVINFSVKMKKKEEERQEDDDSMCSDMKKIIMENSGDFKPKKTEVPVDRRRRHMNVRNNGIVWGIPIWWNHSGIHV